MPYKVRRIDWRLLLDPTMRGIGIEADADARMNQNILRGLVGAGENIVRGRAVTEDRRRFNIQSGRAQRASERADKAHDFMILQHEDALAERKREREINDESLMRELGIEAGTGIVETMQTGQPDPERVARVKQLYMSGGGRPAKMLMGKVTGQGAQPAGQPAAQGVMSFADYWKDLCPN